MQFRKRKKSRQDKTNDQHHQKRSSLLHFFEVHRPSALSTFLRHFVEAPHLSGKEASLVNEQGVSCADFFKRFEIAWFELILRAFQLIEFIAVLLSTSNDAAEKELIKLGAIQQILDLFFEMDGREGSNDDMNIQIRQIFVEFLTEVTRFEHLVSAGLKFLNGFQHGLQLLQQNPTNETSELVKSIIEENENKTLRSYIEAGWTKRQYKVSHMSEMNSCFEGLKDVISKGELIMGELERLMDNAGCALKMIPKSSSDIDECEEDGSMSSERVDATEYAFFMAVIYGMVNQDYVMQEKIVSSLNLMTSIAELGSYCLMWSLRPFIDDDVINQALEYIA